MVLFGFIVVLFGFFLVLVIMCFELFGSIFVSWFVVILIKIIELFVKVIGFLGNFKLFVIFEKCMFCDVFLFIFFCFFIYRKNVLWRGILGLIMVFGKFFVCLKGVWYVILKIYGEYCVCVVFWFKWCMGGWMFGRLDFCYWKW